MSNRIDYAKASSGGYKAFGGVHVYLQKLRPSKGTGLLCVSPGLANKRLRILHRYALQLAHGFASAQTRQLVTSKI